MDRHKDTIDIYNVLAQAYEDKFMNLDLYDDTYDAFCELLPKQSQVLELACGPGNITKYFLSKRPDLSIVATDAAPAMVELASKNNPAALCMKLDYRDLPSQNKKVDAIICGFLLPYLSTNDCSSFFRDCAAILRPEGIAYYSFIEGDPSRSALETSSNGQHSIFVYIHDEKFITTTLRENDLEPIQILKKDYQKSAQHNDIHTIIIARKK
jgi:ubiquinone/menaquinone biosynthesis C-methylase UbiE